MAYAGININLDYKTKSIWQENTNVCWLDPESCGVPRTFQMNNVNHALILKCL